MKAHVDMAHIQASKGSLRASEAQSDRSMLMVIGGLIGPGCFQGHVMAN